MTELDVMKRAKQYMDLLAQGVDPISRRRVPGDSVLSQPRLQKCFSYVSTVLQRDLQRELQKDQPAPQSRSAQPAEPPAAPADAVPLLEFAKQLAASRGLVYAFPLYTTLTAWLRLEDCALFTTVGDQDLWDVTEKGAAMGLTSDGRLLCQPKAQAFLQERLDEILAWNSTLWEPLLEALTPSLCGRVLCSEEAVTLTQFLKRIQGLLPPDLPRKLSAKYINLWLFQQGHLKEHITEQSKTWRPTEQGEELGIHTKSSRNLVFDADAQRYILDHLRDVVSACQSMDLYRQPAQ